MVMSNEVMKALTRDRPTTVEHLAFTDGLGLVPACLPACLPACSSPPRAFHVCADTLRRQKRIADYGVELCRFIACCSGELHLATDVGDYSRKVLTDDKADDAASETVGFTSPRGVADTPQATTRHASVAPVGADSPPWVDRKALPSRQSVIPTTFIRANQLVAREQGGSQSSKPGSQTASPPSLKQLQEQCNELEVSILGDEPSLSLS
jgi:hypothetical protein